MAIITNTFLSFTRLTYSACNIWIFLSVGLVDSILVRDCPKTCFCNPPSKIVYCSRLGFGRIPPGIASDSVQLNLNGNFFESPTLEPDNFTDLRSLEHLYLSECGLERIKPGTFEQLKNLKWLDLSNNRIKSVNNFEFSGLMLQHLFLNGNRHIQLVAESFEGLITTGLYLHDCSLSRLNPDVLVPLNSSLKYLWLNGNELDRFDKRFYDIFSLLSHLRLGSNPLHCNCEIVWLKEFFDTHNEVFKGAVFPSCLTPYRLKGRYISELSMLDLRCQAPMFNNIETMFGSTNGRLKCTASGDPAPTLYWIQPSGKATKYNPPADDEIRLSEGVLNLRPGTVSNDVRLGDSESLFGMYICVATNEAGNVTLTINVSWPLSDSTVSSKQNQVTPENAVSRINLIIPSSSTPAAAVPAHSWEPGAQSPSPRSVVDAANHRSTSQPDLTSGLNNYTILNQVDVLINSDTLGDRAGHQGDLAGRQRRFTVTEFVCAVLGAHVGTLVLCIAVIPLIYRTRWRKRVSEKQRQQQLHHQLHYDSRVEPQQRQLLPHPDNGTPSRSLLLRHQQFPSSSDSDHHSTETDRNLYLNGNGSLASLQRPHRPLYLTDYLLPPQK